MKILAALALTSMLAGCTSTRGEPSDAERFATLVAEPTPPEWRVGAVWEFSNPEPHDGSPSSWIVRVTNTPIETCTSGEWRKLEPIRAPVQGTREPARYAYSVSGRLLMLDFNAGTCDLGDIRGELTDGSFVGQRSAGPFPGRDFVAPRIVGRSVP